MTNQCITTAGRTHQNFFFAPPSKLYKSTLPLKWRDIYLNTQMERVCHSNGCIVLYYQSEAVISSYTAERAHQNVFFYPPSKLFKYTLHLKWLYINFNPQYNSSSTSKCRLMFPTINYYQLTGGGGVVYPMQVLNCPSAPN